jgi:hypothetical protein
MLLQSQGSLLELWLGRNRISKIENLGHMTALRRISLQSNRCVLGRYKFWTGGLTCVVGRVQSPQLFDR